MLLDGSMNLPVCTILAILMLACDLQWQGEVLPTQNIAMQWQGKNQIMHKDERAKPWPTPVRVGQKHTKM
jgi:hypothetical protein